MLWHQNFWTKSCFKIKFSVETLRSQKKKTVIETFWCWSKTLLQTFWICNKTVFRTFIFWSKLFVQTFSNIYVLKQPLVKVFGLNQDLSANLVWSKTLFKQFSVKARAELQHSGVKVVSTARICAWVQSTLHV